MMSTTLPKELLQKLENVSNLPSIPQIMVKIREVSEDLRASAADLANCILSDHQLTSRILRMANSTYYGSYSGKITTVTHAIVVMGFRVVQNIALSMAVYETVNKLLENDKYDITAFWTRSLACGVIAKYLAHRIQQTKAIEEAFIAGFMHDIGQPMLATAFPEKYEQIARLDANSPDMCKAEQVLLGINHLAVGEHVARTWNLPNPLIKPIAEHHRLGKRPDQRSDHVLVDLVYLGDQFCPHVLAGTPADAEVLEPLLEQARALIGVSDKALAAMMTECKTLVSEIALELEVDIHGGFGDRAAVEEELTEVHHQLANKNVQLAFLQSASEALAVASSDDEILQVMCEAVFRGLQMGRVLLFECDDEQESFRGRVGFGVESQKSVLALSFSARTGLFNHVRETGQPISVVSTDSELYQSIVTETDVDRLGMKAFVAVPVRVMDSVRYVLYADAPIRENPIDDESLRSIVSLANQGSMTLERNYFRQQVQPKAPAAPMR